MTRPFAFLLPALICPALFISCAGKVKTSGEFSLSDTLYSPRHASGFVILGSESGTVIEIRNPWQGASEVSHRIFLSENGAPPPAGFEGSALPWPLNSAVCMSSSYVAFMNALDRGDVIKGISGGRFITAENIRERIAAGQISEVGYDSGLNYELISSIKPDVVLAYGLKGDNRALSGKLAEMGVSMIYVGDYVENTPLGKAEWLLFFGELLGFREQADSIFRGIEARYDSVKMAASEVEKRPVVMLNSPWQDSWFVPGDRSYMVRLIRDAGADYACAGVDDDRSRPIGMETAFLAASASDFWLSPGAATDMKELISANPAFRGIKAVRSGMVYNNNARRTPEGGSDFWESGAVYPDRVLSDMIAIFHPELMPRHNLYYFLKLE